MNSLWVLITITITDVGLQCLCPNFFWDHGSSLQHCQQWFMAIWSRNLLRSWWIVELNMRLGGDPNYHDHRRPCIIGLPCQHWKHISTPPTMVYGVLVQHFWGSLWFQTLFMIIRGDHEKHGHQQPFICAFPPNVVNGPQHYHHWLRSFGANDFE